MSQIIYSKRGKHDKDVITDTPFNSEFGYYFKDPVDLIDIHWVGNAYITDSYLLSPSISIGRSHSYGDVVYGNTRFGNSRSLNPLPQFGPYVDKPTGGLMTAGLTSENGIKLQQDVMTTHLTEVGNFGLGAVYSDMISKHEQILYLRGGIPKFANMFNILSGLVDRSLLIAATQGGRSSAYEVGKFVGNALLFVYRPMLFMIITGIKHLAKVVSPESEREYYVVKETMHNVYATIGIILTNMAVELGVIPMSIEVDTKKDNAGMAIRLDANAFEEFGKYYPEFITVEKFNGKIMATFDVYKASMGANRNLKARLKLQQAILDAAEKDLDSGDPSTGLAKDKLLRDALVTYYDMDDFKGENLFTLYERVLGLDSNQYPEIRTIDSSEAPAPVTEKAEAGKEDSTWRSWINDFLNTATDVVTEGNRFIPLTVEYGGETTYTFSNQVGEIGVTRMFNDGSRSIDEFKYNIAGGNLFGDQVNEILRGIKNGLFGVMDGATMGLSNVVAGLLAGGFITLPKKWENSDITVPSHRFKLHMETTSGHPIAQLTSNYVVIASLLALTLPKSIGVGAYVSPYLLMADLQGVCSLKNCMVNNLTISYGTGNIGRSSRNSPIAFEVTFDLVDMSEIFAAPVPDPAKGPIATVQDDKDPLSAFIRNMTGATLYRQTDERLMNQSKRNRLSKYIMNAAQRTSSAYAGSMLGSMLEFIHAPTSTRGIADILGK